LTSSSPPVQPQDDPLPPEPQDPPHRPTTLAGIFVPLITPFDEAGRVDLVALERLADRCLASGAAGIVALGTTGEHATLSPGERDDVVQRCAEVCGNHQAPLVVGAGGNNTDEAAREVETRAASPGVVAILSVVPYYTRPSEAGIIAHFRVLAGASAVPIIIYNIPFRTGRRLSAEALLELADDPRIIGVKHSVDGVDEDTLRLLRDLPEGFSVLAGDDAFLFSMLCLGASGGITASAHLCTESFVAMTRAVLDGDMVGGREHAYTLAPLIAALFAEPNPAVVKGVLAARNQIATAALRLPLIQASDAAVDNALHALRSVEQRRRPIDSRQSESSAA
jgi:4-hydroxy-tetrahydrodipicolinate synthase